MKNEPKVVLTVEIGYEIRQVVLTTSEWAAVLSGTQLQKEVVDIYDGEQFIYDWKFNFPGATDSLVVEYRQEEDIWSLATGFAGDVHDAMLHYTDDENVR